MGKNWGKCKIKRPADDLLFLVLTSDFITIIIEASTDVVRVRTEGRLEATDMLACGRVIDKNRFLIVKYTPFELLTSGIRIVCYNVSTKLVQCFLHTWIVNL